MPRVVDTERQSRAVKLMLAKARKRSPLSRSASAKGGRPTRSAISPVSFTKPLQTAGILWCHAQSAPGLPVIR